MRRQSDIDEERKIRDDRICEMRELGVNLVTIANTIRCHPDTVAEVLQRRQITGHRIRMTPPRQATLDFFRERQRAGLPPPSMREIAAKFGWSSTNAVADVLRALERLGKVRQACGKHRSRGWILNENENDERLRPGLPTNLEISLHDGLWIGRLWIAGYNAVVIGYFGRYGDGRLSFHPSGNGSVIHHDELLRQAAAETPCAFWPCDRSGNKIDLPTKPKEAKKP